MDVLVLRRLPDNFRADRGDGHQEKQGKQAETGNTVLHKEYSFRIGMLMKERIRGGNSSAEKKEISSSSEMEMLANY